MCVGVCVCVCVCVLFCFPFSRAEGILALGRIKSDVYLLHHWFSEPERELFIFLILFVSSFVLYLSRSLARSLFLAPRLGRLSLEISSASAVGYHVAVSSVRTLTLTC